MLPALYRVWQLRHQDDMPEVAGPEGLTDLTEVPPEDREKMPDKMRRFLTKKRPFEIRPVDPIRFDNTEKLPASHQVWIRAVDRVPDSEALHQNLLAYVSDYELLGAATLPHGLSFSRGNVIMASLDHAMWFHRPFRADEWLLYVQDSPSASGARGLNRGLIYDRNGSLVASAAQEGLMRVHEDD